MFEFDLQLFAQAPSGQLITFGLGKETGGYGVPATPTVFLIPSSDDLDGTNGLIARPGARGIIGQAEELTGLYTAKGTIPIEVDPDTFGVPLLLTMGAESIAANANNPSSSESVNTTLSNAVPVGFGPATPAAMTNISIGDSLTIGSGETQETVVVKATSTSQFWAYFTNVHASGETVANASLVLAYDHTFTLASPRSSFTIQQNDVISAKNAFGAKMSTLSLKISPKAVIEASCGVNYQGEAAVDSPVSPTYSTLKGLVFNTTGNSVTFNNAALDQSVQAISLDINVGLVTDYPRFGNGRYQGEFPETQTKVKASLDLAFESDTMLQAFWGSPGATGPQSQVLPAPLIIVFQSVEYVNAAVPYMLQIAIPMAKISGAPVARKVGDYLKQTVQIETSQSRQGAGDDVQFILTNAASGASF